MIQVPDIPQGIRYNENNAARKHCIEFDFIVLKLMQFKEGSRKVISFLLAGIQTICLDNFVMYNIRGTTLD